AGTTRFNSGWTDSSIRPQLLFSKDASNQDGYNVKFWYMEGFPLNEILLVDEDLIIRDGKIFQSCNGNDVEVGSYGSSVLSVEKSSICSRYRWFDYFFLRYESNGRIFFLVKDPTFRIGETT